MPAQELLDLVTTAEELERAVGDYYAALAELLPDFLEPFELLRGQEEFHARTFASIRTSMGRTPGAWRAGPFELAAVLRLRDDVREAAARVRALELGPLAAVQFIADVEGSMLEQRFLSALESDLEDYRRLLVRVRDDTTSHRELLWTILESPRLAQADAARTRRRPA